MADFLGEMKLNDIIVDVIGLLILRGDFKCTFLKR